MAEEKKDTSDEDMNIEYEEDDDRFQLSSQQIIHIEKSKENLYLRRFVLTEIQLKGIERALKILNEYPGCINGDGWVWAKLIKH